MLETQAKRCKEILLNLSKNPQNMQDTFLKKTTISSLVNLNFEKFLKDNTHLKMNIEKINTNNEPLINSSDEIIYSLGNIIQNAIEHARNSIDVNISWNKEFIFISIKDDGKGLSKNNTDNHNASFGIFGMKERASILGGKLEIESTPKEGTAIIVELPLQGKIKE